MSSGSEGRPDQRTVAGGLDEPDELEPEQGSLHLASAEDDHARADWEKAAAAVLRKGRRLGDDDPDDAVWDRLARHTLDDIAVAPLGTAADLDRLETSGRPERSGDWDIRAHLSVPAGAEKAVNEAALLDLTNGVTSLWLQGPGTSEKVDLAATLDGVLLDLAPVVLDGIDPAAFLAYVGDRELHPATNLGGVVSTSSTDEGGGSTDEGGGSTDEGGGSTDEGALCELANRARAVGVLGFVVDATRIHDRGASDAQELAWSLAAGATYLRTLTDAGLAVDEAAELVEFRYAATDEQFATIAKLRAARRLWARVLELSEATGRTQRQHVVTSRPMMSAYDPWVNMLRTTVAAFAAGVGGADAVTVLPFDSPLGVPDAFGRRIARNTSSVLISESHVARVADPAGGSYAVERLTDDLARTAWEIFGRLEDGADLDELVAATVERRDREVATRQRPITGLTEFPHLGETLPERVSTGSSDETPVRRYGAAFEALRDDPAPRPVLLATLGSVAAHTARATFASNLLAAGGIAVTTKADEAGEAGAVACIAGTDAAYDHEGAERAAALREAGASWIIVAGKPREWADDSAAMGVDALDFLTRTREKLT